ncbi:hypothetical protein PR202_ga12879 [Eleusine coracana subsp. coracana]|uniref:Auxin response factor domain-containing protein n=1 Tax=Eleusine coracana subsp. coracana TaxID=191504 RepID=A0AAV5CD79_ELECO|nr:hypothetical protein PR202_ga12879 [Eleusine coracana subsp. coracana]
MAGGGEEGCVDAQLWLACAGGMCLVPPVGPVGPPRPSTSVRHARPTVCAVPRSCRAVHDRSTERRGGLRQDAPRSAPPLGAGVVDVGEAMTVGMTRSGDNHNKAKTLSFAKTLTQSDVNNNAEFSILRYYAETILPMLDYRAKPPVQTIYAKDVSGVVWKFQHIYRGSMEKRLAAAGQPFEVVHYPWARSPEFFVRAAKVREAMQMHWCPGMRIKMAFQMLDMSRVSWFMGTISGVQQAADPRSCPVAAIALTSPPGDMGRARAAVEREVRLPLAGGTDAFNHHLTIGG